MTRKGRRKNSGKIKNSPAPVAPKARIRAWQDFSSSHELQVNGDSASNRTETAQARLRLRDPRMNGVPPPNNDSQAPPASNSLMQADKGAQLRGDENHIHPTPLSSEKARGNRMSGKPSQLETCKDLTDEKGLRGPVMPPSRRSSVDSSEEVIVFRGKNKRASTSLSEDGFDANPFEIPTGPYASQDAALEDYASNLLMHDDSEGEKRGGSPSSLKPNMSCEGNQDLDISPRHATSLDKNKGGFGDEDDWSSSDLEVLDGFSTSSETLRDEPMILRHRKRGNETQYLVVSAENTHMSPLWLRREQMTDPSTPFFIAEYESHMAQKSLLRDDEGESDSDSDLLEDLDKEERTLRITDEQMARLLDKQAELGMTADELVLYNGEGLLSDSDLDDVIEDSLAFSAPKKGQRAKKGKKSKRPGEADAFTMGLINSDPYGGFDVMDRERPSIQTKSKKGRRKQAAMYTSDTDLQDELATAWENDRQKKKLRKQEREELRAQGLLGQNGKIDLKAKYRDGMTLDEAKSEIKTFLMSPALETLALPPMSNDTRRIIHGIANKASMKSKSQGNGPSRFPVLYKTPRSKNPTPAMLASIDKTGSRKKFLPRQNTKRQDVPVLRRGRFSGGGGGGGGNNNTTGASYRNGEVVGVGAPELGEENRGRAMLEKMGWTHGTALGALNNKGIMQPVSHVVKTGKAGLG